MKLFNKRNLQSLSFGLVAVVSLIGLSAPSAVYAASSSKPKHTKHRSAGTKSPFSNGGTIQYRVFEVKTVNGKKTKSPAGSVAVKLTSTKPSAKCRDAGVVYARQGNVVFTGKTDGARSHGDNYGRIRVDRCTAGNTYTASLVLADGYKAVGKATQKVTFSKVKGKNKTIRVLNFEFKKTSPDATPTEPSPAAAGDPLPVDTNAGPQVSAGVTTPVAVIPDLIDTTRSFEDDNIIGVFGGEDTDPYAYKPDVRKAHFAANGSGYFTPNMINMINSTYGGDPYPLLGLNVTIRDYCSGQLEGNQVVRAGNATTASVDHVLKYFPCDDSTAAPVTKTITYNLVQSNDTWLIDGITNK